MDLGQPRVPHGLRTVLERKVPGSRASPPGLSRDARKWGGIQTAVSPVTPSRSAAPLARGRVTRQMLFTARRRGWAETRATRGGENACALAPSCDSSRAPGVEHGDVCERTGSGSQLGAWSQQTRRLRSFIRPRHGLSIGLLAHLRGRAWEPAPDKQSPPISSDPSFRGVNGASPRPSHTPHDDRAARPLRPTPRPVPRAPRRGAQTPGPPGVSRGAGAGLEGSHALAPLSGCSAPDLCLSSSRSPPPRTPVTGMGAAASPRDPSRRTPGPPPGTCLGLGGSRLCGGRSEAWV